jgi:F0F1-type ATP synthase assembly protein I
MRLLGLGTELAGFTLIFLGAGYFVDSVRAHQTPYATAFGTMIGFTLGMIRFILQVNKIAEEVTIAPQVTDETDEVNKVNEADEVNEVNDDTKQD